MASRREESLRHRHAVAAMPRGERSSTPTRRWRRGERSSTPSRRWRRGERRDDGVAVSGGLHHRHMKARGRRGIPITASDGRHLRLCAPRQSAASSTQTPASRLDAWTQWPSSASVVPATALPLVRRCSGHVTTSSVCTAQAVAVVLSMRDAATMQPTAAASKGSTRALYLSCDGSLWRGLSSALALGRRSIIPRLRLGLFCFPSAGLGLAGLCSRRSRRAWPV